MNLSFEFLADHPDDVPRILAWWHTVWAENMGHDLERYEADFRATLGSENLPLDIVAVLDGQIIGTAALKNHEMDDVYLDYRYWMGSVFVVPECRGRGIATRLASRIIELARERHLPHLYLQTVDLSGGLYTALGWEPRHRLKYRGKQTLVMFKPLD